MVYNLFLTLINFWRIFLDRHRTRVPNKRLEKTNMKSIMDSPSGWQIQESQIFDFLYDPKGTVKTVRNFYNFSFFLFLFQPRFLKSE